MNEHPIFDQLAREHHGRHHWRDDTGEVDSVGRHLDADGDGLADQADPDFAPEFTPAYPTWTPCEDRDQPHDDPGDQEA